MLALLRNHLMIFEKLMVYERNGKTMPNKTLQGTCEQRGFPKSSLAANLID